MLYYIAGTLIAYSMRGVIMSTLYTVGEMIVSKVVNVTVSKTGHYVAEKITGGDKKDDKKNKVVMVDAGTETEMTDVVN
jgi:hypothetical protein